MSENCLDCHEEYRINESSGATKEPHPAEKRAIEIRKGAGARVAIDLQQARKRDPSVAKRRRLQNPQNELKALWRSVDRDASLLGCRSVAACMGEEWDTLLRQSR